MVIGIIQARMGSTRFPGKVLKKIKGKTLLELYVNRVKKSKYVDKIVVATTTLPEDDLICDLAHHTGIDCFRGSQIDLVDRFYKCAKEYHSDVIVRFTADNPFVDYEVVDKGVSLILDKDADFVTNHFEPTYPEGLDTEVYKMQTMETIWKEAKLLSEREHVFPYVQNNSNKFYIINFKQKMDYSYLRWTLDYECDFEMAKIIYDNLYDKNEIFLQQDILNLIKKKPEIAKLNAHIKRKEGVNKTKNEDRILEI